MIDREGTNAGGDEGRGVARNDPGPSTRGADRSGAALVRRAL